MNSKDTQENTQEEESYRLIVFLPARTKDALFTYIRDEFPPKSRVRTAIVVKALDQFLANAGYLKDEEVINEITPPTS